jgi:hypothetical protein
MAALSPRTVVNHNGFVQFGSGGCSEAPPGTCNQFVGAKASKAWKVHEPSGGYLAGSSVAFTFRLGADTAQSTNNQYYFALPAAINPAKVAVVPKLPNAGHPLMPGQYNWMLLLLIPAIGVLGWISVKPD